MVEHVMCNLNLMATPAFLKRGTPLAIPFKRKVSATVFTKPADRRLERRHRQRAGLTAARSWEQKGLGWKSRSVTSTSGGGPFPQQFWSFAASVALTLVAELEARFRESLTAEQKRARTFGLSLIA